MFATLLLASLAPVVFAQAADKPATLMEQSMKELDAAFKNLGRELKSPDVAQKPAYLEWAATIKAEAVKSRELVPQKIAELPTAEQAAMKADYLKEMDAFIATVGDLEKSLREERWADADVIIKAMRKAKSQGHENFKKE